MEEDQLVCEYSETQDHRRSLSNNGSRTAAYRPAISGAMRSPPRLARTLAKDCMLTFMSSISSKSTYRFLRERVEIA